MSDASGSWRVSDVVTYEAMRELANDVIASLLVSIEGRNQQLEAAARVRAEAAAVTPTDRATLEGMSERLRLRLAELRESA